MMSVLATLALSACGTTQSDRAISGGLIGAGAGAAVGAATGSTATGAAIGGVVGAVAGAAIDPCKLNLGDPVWKDKNASREDYRRQCGHYPNS
jgi:osmotically inducible lipoprotein OsmB